MEQLRGQPGTELRCPGRLMATGICNRRPWERPTAAAQVSLDMGNPRLLEPGFLLQPCLAQRHLRPGAERRGLRRKGGSGGSLAPLPHITFAPSSVLGPPAHNPAPSAGPGKICAVPGNLLTSEKWVLEIKPHPKGRGMRAGGGAEAGVCEQQPCRCALTLY